MRPLLLAVLLFAVVIAVRTQTVSYMWSNTYTSASYCATPSTYGNYSVTAAAGWVPLGLSDNLKVMFNGSALLLNCTGICDTIFPNPCASYISFGSLISLNTTRPIEVYRDVFVGPCQGDPACYTEFVANVIVSSSSEEHEATVAKNNARHNARRMH
jgi:hypothetical protein